MKQGKRIIMKLSAVLFGLLFGLCTLQERVVVASENGEGTLTIQLNDLGTSMEGVGFTAYKIAVTDGESGKWMIDENLASYNPNVDLNKEKTASEWDSEAASLAEHVKKAKVTGVLGETDSTGRLTWSNLEKGMYLVVQSDAAAYGNVSSLLIAIPYEVNGVWENEVTVNPKGERFPQEKEEPKDTEMPDDNEEETGTAQPENKEDVKQKSHNKSVATGDHANWGVYAILAIAAFTGGMAVLIFKRKKKNSRAVVSLFLMPVVVSMVILPTFAADETASATNGVPEWATNVTVETPPDDQYIYQFSDVCPLYQRGQYRFGCGAYNCSPNPIILLINGSECNESTGKTWTANGIEYTPGVSNYELTYCADFDTSTVTDQFYKKVNVEDSTYFESGETAYKLRAIVGNTYPFVAAVDMVKDLYAKNVITDESILLNGKTFADELTTADIDVGQLIAASQMAIWVTCNDTMDSASVTAGYHTYYTLHPDNTFMQAKGKLNPIKGYLYAEDENETEFPMTERQAKNINAIYQYLTELEPVTEEEAERNQQLVITDVAYDATKTGTGSYNLTVKTVLNTAVKKNDNLTLKVSASKPDSAGNAIEATKVFVSQGSGDVIGKEFTFSLKDVPAGATITIELSGNQYLNNGVYFYEPYVAEGETERSTSQNLVGASAGYTPVKAMAGFQIDDTAEGPAESVLPSTGGMGVLPFYGIGGMLVLGSAGVLLKKRRASTDHEKEN